MLRTFPMPDDRLSASCRVTRFRWPSVVLRLQELYGKLQALVHGADPMVVSDLRLCMHVVNSLLVSCP